jgi:hypothetical protein
VHEWAQGRLRQRDGEEAGGEAAAKLCQGDPGRLGRVRALLLVLPPFATRLTLFLRSLRYYAPIRKRKKEGVQLALFKFSFRLLSRLARIRKRLAKKKVLQFYSDFSRQR